jgi:hypothetical protein
MSLRSAFVHITTPVSSTKATMALVSDGDVAEPTSSATLSSLTTLVNTSYALYELSADPENAIELNKSPEEPSNRPKKRLV